MKLKNVEFALEFFEPAEVAFLILYSYNNWQKYRKNVLNNNEDLIEVVQVEGDEVDPEPDDSDSRFFTGSLSMTLEVKDHSDFSIVTDGDYTGSVIKGSEGSYEDPPGPDDYILEDVTVDTVNVSMEEGDYLELDRPTCLNTTVSYNEIIKLANYCLTENINCDSFSKGFIENYKKNKSIGVPPALAAKIEKVMKDNERSITPKILGKKYDI